MHFKDNVSTQVMTNIPPNQFEPMETVVERVTASQGTFSILSLIGWGHLSSSIVHFSHLVQPLPAKAEKSSQELTWPQEWIGPKITFQNLHDTILKCRCLRWLTWASPETSSAWLHSSGLGPLQPPRFEGKALRRVLSLALGEAAPGAAENTVCPWVRQTGTGPVNR